MSTDWRHGDVPRANQTAGGGEPLARLRMARVRGKRHRDAHRNYTARIGNWTPVLRAHHQAGVSGVTSRYIQTRSQIHSCCELILFNFYIADITQGKRAWYCWLCTSNCLLHSNHIIYIKRTGVFLILNYPVIVNWIIMLYHTCKNVTSNLAMLMHCCDIRHI